MPKNSLEYWGVPAEACKKYKDMGISSLFPWQVECLEQPHVLQGTSECNTCPPINRRL